MALFVFFFQLWGWEWPSWGKRWFNTCSDMEVKFTTQSRIKLRRVSSTHFFWIIMLVLLLFYASGLFSPLHNPMDFNRFLDLTNCHIHTNHIPDFAQISGKLPKNINAVYIQVRRHVRTWSHNQEYVVAIYTEQINTHLHGTSQDIVSLQSVPICLILIENAVPAFFW